MSKKENTKIKEEEIADQDTSTVEETENEETNEKDSKPKSKKKAKKSKDDEIEELRYKLAEVNDKYLRLFSDFDNYRKRSNAEKLEIIKTASRDVIEGLLPVVDDFDRALQAFGEQEVDKDTIHGVELIQSKLFNLLKKQGLEPMDSMGKDFNTDYHDALTQIPAPSEDLKGKVVDVIEKGYLLNGTIIRHAKVVVGQ